MTVATIRSIRDYANTRDAEDPLNACSKLVYPKDTLRAMKDSGLRIRVERELRDKFLVMCREQDRPAAQVLREFMRRYVAEDREVSVKIAPKKNQKNKKNK